LGRREILKKGHVLAESSEIAQGKNPGGVEKSGEFRSKEETSGNRKELERRSRGERSFVCPAASLFQEAPKKKIGPQIASRLEEKRGGVAPDGSGEGGGEDLRDAREGIEGQ